MPLRTLTTVRFSMKADVLKPGEYIPDPIDVEQYGEWVENQDPLTGEIIKVWEPSENQQDNPDTPDYNEFKKATIPCLARGIVDGGIRVAGNTERFSETYENIEYVKLWTPPHILLTKRDRITNIRNQKGQYMWVDEEFDDPADINPPKSTMFNINGVTPLFDAFNKHVENFILLERAEV